MIDKPNKLIFRWDYDTYDWNCNRRDGRNLIEEWEGNNTDGVYVGNRSSLMNLSMNETKVLGMNNLA